MEKKDDIGTTDGVKKNTERLPYEFEVPENLWGMLISQNEIPRNPQAKLYATIIPNGDLIVRGITDYNVPSFNPFAQAFYQYLERAGNLSPELAALRAHPAVQKIIDEVRKARELYALYRPSNNGPLTGGGH